ncbi:MAG TPA: methyltransferase [Jatrophihabitans sp.]|nr:methyltransferase [Jatrophihabitans sp.]
MPEWKPLLPDRELDRLRQALDGYTVDGVHELIGLEGQASLGRGDLNGVARCLRSVDDRVATLVRLFLLGAEVSEAAARAALHPLSLDSAGASGLLACSAGAACARIDVRPYAEASAATGDAPWWVISDFGSDVRTGPLAADHVLGVGSASLTLAQATPRAQVGRVLDVGTGCGVQALHAARHSAHVCATDTSARALRFAATTAALSGQRWQLRQGSLLDPVAGERFDLVVANPPFVVSGGTRTHDYRDSGLAGDGVCRALITGLPDVLADSGTAVLLANWIIPRDGDWQARLQQWLAGTGCDAWVWQREVADPGQYVAMWLRDAGEQPGTSRWAERYDAWRDVLDAAGVAALGMGLVALWRTDAATPVRVLEDVPQAIEQPIGAALPAWILRQRRLAACSDEQLLRTALRPAAGVVRTRDEVLGPQGWRSDADRLRQTSGMRWEVEVDDAIAALVAGLDGSVSLLAPLSVLAGAFDRSVDELAAAALPVVRDLVGRGFLEWP